MIFVGIDECPVSATPIRTKILAGQNVSCVRSSVSAVPVPLTTIHSCVGANEIGRFHFLVILICLAFSGSNTSGQMHCNSAFFSF